MKGYTSRMRLMDLYQYLREHTDSDHPATTGDLISYLHKDCQIDTDRNVLSRDLSVLTSIGNIKVRRSSQNLYYYDGWLFQAAELRLLIDAVASSKFITTDDSDALIGKLQKLSPPGSGEYFERNISVAGRIKSKNEFNYKIVDILNQAINEKKQVQFRYIAFDAQKHRVQKHDGGMYTVSPYALIWDGDYYYLIGYCTSHDTIQNFRVDRISREPKILEEKKAVPAPKGFSVVEYQKKSFRMYSGAKEEEVTLLCENGAMNSVIDQFGRDVDTEIVDADHFRVRAVVYPGPTFYRWVFGFGGAIRILSPACVQSEYSQMLHEALEAQEGDQE